MSTTTNTSNTDNGVDGIYSIPVKNIFGVEEPFGKYAQGKVVLVVNVASQCGFTPQYAGLEELHQKYKDKGFSVIGFPCNQFGGQEPGNDEEIQQFCTSKFKTTFPVLAKVDVNGAKEAPLYKHLKSKKSSLMMQGIMWNFAKFLIGRDGTVVERYLPTTSPASIAIDIEKQL